MGPMGPEIGMVCLVIQLSIEQVFASIEDGSSVCIDMLHGGEHME